MALTWAKILGKLAASALVASEAAVVLLLGLGPRALEDPAGATFVVGGVFTLNFLRRLIGEFGIRRTVEPPQVG